MFFDVDDYSTMKGLYQEGDKKHTMSVLKYLTLRDLFLEQIQGIFSFSNLSFNSNHLIKYYAEEQARQNLAIYTFFGDNVLYYPLPAPIPSYDGYCPIFFRADGWHLY